MLIRIQLVVDLQMANQNLPYDPLKSLHDVGGQCRASKSGIDVRDPNFWSKMSGL